MGQIGITKTTKERDVTRTPTRQSFFRDGISVVAILLLTMTLVVSPTGAEQPEGVRYQWPRARILTVDVEIDPVIAQEWLPPTVTLRPNTPATVFIAEYPDSTCCGAYNETAIVLPVQHEGVDRKHCPWMLVTGDTALVKGRDILGFPKKLGEIVLETNRTTREVTATVDRHGASLFAFHGTVAARSQNPPGVFGGEWCNVWGVRPHLDLQGDLVNMPRVLVQQINEAPIVVFDINLDQAKFGEGPDDPIGELGFGNVVAAQFYLIDVGQATDPAPISRDEVTLEWVDRTSGLRNW